MHQEALEICGAPPSRRTYKDGKDDYIRWLGTHLQELEPDLEDPDTAAWNALSHLHWTEVWP